MTPSERELILFLGRSTLAELRRHAAFLDSRSGPDSDRLADQSRGLVAYMENLIGRVAADAPAKEMPHA